MCFLTRKSCWLGLKLLFLVADSPDSYLPPLLFPTTFLILFFFSSVLAISLISPVQASSWDKVDPDETGSEKIHSGHPQRVGVWWNRNLPHIWWACSTVSQSVHLERYETMRESQTGDQCLKHRPKSSFRTQHHFSFFFFFLPGIVVIAPGPISWQPCLLSDTMN